MTTVDEGVFVSVRNEKSQLSELAFLNMVEGDGFEPSKAVPADLQSDPFGHSGTPPGCFYT